MRTLRADATLGLGVVCSTSEPIAGCFVQRDCRTARSESASSVSSSLGRASGLPIGPDLDLLACRWGGGERVGGTGEEEGEKDILSST